MTPTDAELQILQVLWRRGPSTVREVHDVLGTDNAYTTTLKLLQIMLDKRLVRRDASRRSHVYQAAVEEGRVTGSLVTDLVDKAFAGSASRLVMRALSARQTSPEELDAIRDLLDKLEER